jgi:hypothetical protein
MEGNGIRHMSSLSPHSIRAYREVEVQLHRFLTSTLEVSGQLHAPAALAPRNNTGTH